MRGVSGRAPRVAPLLAVFLVLTAAGAWADGPPAPPTDPLEARASPPVGVTAQARLQPPSGIAPPPPPDTTTQARMNPPVGEPMTLTEMLLRWLQSRLSVPNG